MALGYQHPFPSLSVIESEMDKIKMDYADEMRRIFPKGTPVRVNHWRGSYSAVVAGYDPGRKCVMVTNINTGKHTYIYPGLRVGIDDSALPCLVVEG